MFTKYLKAKIEDFIVNNYKQPISFNRNKLGIIWISYN